MKYLISNFNAKLFKTTSYSLLLGCAFLSTVSNYTALAEDHKAASKPGRIIKRKPQERKQEKPHHESIKGPEALESSENFPSAEEATESNNLVEAVLLLDSSRSMQKTDPKRVRDQGAKLFLQFLEPEDKASIIEFADTANILTDLKKMKELSPEDINAILESIKNEGNFTNFIPPLDSAVEILSSNENKSTSKVIILITDGQMDPSSDISKKEGLLEELLKEKVPQIAKKGIKVYTLALSDLADRDLLTQIAKKTHGHSEYAQDVNTIHKIFSDLFLSIKKPQVLELESGGFSIDGSTGEATFYINRQTESDSITVIDPTGHEYTNKDFPSRWKWFRGDLFDVITIPSPLPGRWGITGGSGDLSGFAKLLSDLKLEYSFPSQSYSIGDSVIVKSRLTEGGKVLDDANLSELIFYTFRIVNSRNGQIYAQGQLNDKGERGDEKINDGVFSETITLNEEGEYKLFIVATAPTFTRQAHLPFSVNRGIISLEHISANQFTGSADRYQVTLHSIAKELTKRIVAIEAENHGEKYQINLEKHKLSEDSYEIPLEKLKSGDNVVIALVQGLDSSKKEVKAKSEEVRIEVEAHVNEHPEEVSEIKLEVDDHSSEENVEPASEESNLIFGVIGTIISLIISGFLSMIFLKKAKTEGGTQVVVRDAYEVPASINEQLEVLQSKASKEPRQFYPSEMEIFKNLIPEEEFSQTKEPTRHSETEENPESEESPTDTDQSEESTEQIEEDSPPSEQDVGEDSENTELEPESETT